MATLIILSIVSAYFFVTGMYRLLNKNRKNIYLPDEDMNIFICKLDKATYFFGFTSIFLGILSFFMAIQLWILYPEMIQNPLQISESKFCYIFLWMLIIGMLITISSTNGAGNIYGDLMLIKRDIIYFYEIQKFKSRTEWMDYPDYSGYKKDYFLSDINKLNTRYYLIFIGKMFFLMGGVGLYFCFLICN